MQLSRRALLGGAVVITTVTGCADRVGPPSPSGTPTRSMSFTPSASASPTTRVRLLTEPGVARQVVTQLRTAAGGQPVLKVDLSAEAAQVSVLDDKTPRTWAWSANTITEVGGDIAYIGQATFDPADFRIDDLGTLFGIAGALTGSLSNQQLQIVDHNQGEVLMTVTTRPESRPVFFRRDGSPIHELDYTSESGIAEGLSDALGGRTQLVAIGYDAAQGLWADSADPADDSVIMRRTRPAKLPPWGATRKETPPDLVFTAVDVDPAVLAMLMRQLPARLGKQGDTRISWTIDMRHQLGDPTITVVVGGQTVVCDLEGHDITATVS